MSRILTASDRSALIRLASTMEKGSEGRRVLLAALAASDKYLLHEHFSPQDKILRALNQALFVAEAGLDRQGTDDHGEFYKALNEYADPEYAAELGNKRWEVFGRLSNKIPSMVQRFLSTVPDEILSNPKYKPYFSRIKDYNRRLTDLLQRPPKVWTQADWNAPIETIYFLRAPFVEMGLMSAKGVDRVKPKAWR